jgi:AcrR family transcriptional regulator
LDAVRKAQIRAAAADVIAEQGLAATRVADIAARAGTSASAIIYWFKDKDRLLAEALSFKDEQFYVGLEVQLDGCDTAADQLAVVLAQILHNYDWRLWVEICNRAMRDETTAATRRTIDRRWRALLTGIIERGIEAGEFDAVDPVDAVLSIAGLLDGFGLQLALADPDFDRERAARMWRERVRAWLGATLPPIRREHLCGREQTSLTAAAMRSRR